MTRGEGNPPSPRSNQLRLATGRPHLATEDQLFKMPRRKRAEVEATCVSFSSFSAGLVIISYYRRCSSQALATFPGVRQKGAIAAACAPAWPPTEHHGGGGGGGERAFFKVPKSKSARGGGEGNPMVCSLTSQTALVDVPAPYAFWMPRSL